MANVRNLESALASTTSLKPLASPAGDMAKYGLRYVAADPTDAVKARNYFDSQSATRSAAGAATAAVLHYAKHHKDQVGKEEGLFQEISPIVNGVESLVHYGLGADMVINFGLPIIGGAAGFVGLKGLGETLSKPHNYLHSKLPDGSSKLPEGKASLGHNLQQGLFIGLGAIEAYGVAKTFSQNLNALKHMHADISGIPVERISAWSLLTAKVSPVVEEARSHLLKEFIPKGLTQLGGLAWLIRVALRGPKASTFESLASLMGPQALTMGIDMFMGESILPVYSGFANAYKKGEPLPADAYAGFILAGSEDLKKRKVGKQVATELGAEFAKNKTDPAEILREMNDGRFRARIDKLIVRDEAELARQTALKQQKAEAAQPAKSISHVEKIGGGKQDRPAIGKFTGKLSEENQGLSHSVT